MRHVLSLSLLSAASLASLLCPLAARPDSLPTLPATSVTYSHQDNVNSWSISGDSFGVSGAGATITYGGFAMPGQVPNLLDLPFSETIGSHGFTEGGLALDGVGYPVVMLNTPSFVYSSDSVYNPGIVGSAYNPNYPRQSGNVPGTVDVIASVPVTVEADSGLNETLNPCPPGNGHLGVNGPCVGNALANVSIDVPGYLILRGFRDPGDDYDTITQANFSAIPEPRAFGLLAIGLLAAMLFKSKKEISAKPRCRQG